MTLGSYPTRSWSGLDGVFLLAVAAIAALASRLLRLDGLIGLRNDDGHYVLVAKAIAQGAGLVNLADPSHPPATYYPAGFSALLAPIFWLARDWDTQLAVLQGLTLAMSALFVALAYVFFRRVAGWPSVGAGLAACLVALHPETHYLGGKLLSDLPFAVLSLLALFVIERGWARSDAGGWWALAGVIGGAAALVRYQGFALALAVGLVLTIGRRWRPLAGFGAGWALLWVPWLAWRWAAEAGHYVSAYANETREAGSTAFTQVVQFVLGQALPGLLAPALFEGRDALTFAIGLTVSAAVAWGAWRLVRAPRGLSPVPGAYMLVTLALVLVWSRGFLYLEDELPVRLLYPLLPVVLVAVVHTGEALWQRLALPAPAARHAAIAAAVVGLTFSVGLFNRNLHHHRTIVLASAPQAEYTALFEFLRTRTPSTARLHSWIPAMVHLYTGRPAVSFSIDHEGAKDMAGFLAAYRIDYLVGSPQIRVESDQSKVTTAIHRQVDLSVARLNALQQAYPDVLRPIFVNPRGTMVVFAVDQAALGRHGLR